MSLNGGDVLARGAKSAQFNVHSDLSDFEYDLSIGKDNEELKEKYGLSEAELTDLRARRGEGERIDIHPAQSLADSVEVVDKRRFVSALEEDYHGVMPVEKKQGKYVEKIYSDPTTILDRVLIKRIIDDPDLEQLEDGTVRNKKTGFIIPQAYRQHNNVGIVLAVGQLVVLGGVRISLTEIVRPGDRVTFGDYNSEVYHQPSSITEAMCDAVEMNYEEDPEGLRVVRVQDIRTVCRPRKASWWQALKNLYYEFLANMAVYHG